MLSSHLFTDHGKSRLKNVATNQIDEIFLFLIQPAIRTEQKPKHLNSLYPNTQKNQKTSTLRKLKKYMNQKHLFQRVKI